MSRRDDLRRQLASWRRDPEFPSRNEILIVTGVGLVLGLFLLSVFLERGWPVAYMFIWLTAAIVCLVLLLVYLDRRRAAKRGRVDE